jgi:hypothetical protein
MSCLINFLIPYYLFVFIKETIKFILSEVLSFEE